MEDNNKLKTSYKLESPKGDLPCKTFSEWLLVLIKEFNKYL